MTIGEFYEKIIIICAKFDCSVTSGPRTDKRNTSVGGVAGSQHRLIRGGKAVDIVPDDNTLERRREIMAYATEMGLWVLDESNHIHVDGRR